MEKRILLPVKLRKIARKNITAESIGETPRVSVYQIVTQQIAMMKVMKILVHPLIS